MRVQAYLFLGWSPILAVVVDGSRDVLQVTGWSGGTGTAPATGLYVGATGYVALIADAVDIRGGTGATGAAGATGATGATGAGVATGGTANQALTKIDGTNFNTQWATIDKTFVGLGNVDNTSDATKNSAVATLTNKTLTSPVINTPTGIVKGDVGLGNVDNTSDATKNAAAVTLTNKTITAPVIATIVNTGTLTLPTATDTLVGKATTDILTNKSIVATQLTGTLQAAQEPAHTGDVTNSSGSLAMTIANDAVTTAKILNAAVTYAKIQNFAAYKFLANNTVAAATPTEITYRDNGTQTYVGTDTWNGTAPSGSSNKTYHWVQIGNMVTLTITINYSVAGVTNTILTLTFPSDCPTPFEPTGTGAANDKIYPGFGYIDSAISGNPAASRAVLGVNAGDTGYLLSIVAGSTSAKAAQVTVIYYTN